MATATIATVSDLREYLEQASLGVGTNTKMQKVLNRAESIVVDRLEGLSFGAYGGATARVVHGYGGEILSLPRHQAGSITVVKDQWGTVWPGALWTENEDGSLWSGNSTGVSFYWEVCRYTVTAKWGAGPAPDSLVEVVLEVATNLWRERDKGAFTDAIGVEAGGEVRVGYQRGLTNRQRDVIDQIKRLYATLPVV